LPGLNATIVALDGKPAPYKLTPASRQECWDGDRLTQTTAEVPTAFAGTTAGTLIAAGQTCKDLVAAEVWKPGSRASELEVLSGRPESRYALVLVRGAHDDAWLLGHFVAHYDGAAWKVLGDSPGGVGFRAGAAAPDGTLWAVDEAGGVHHLAGGAWERVPLPIDLKADDIAAYDGVLYVSAGGSLLRYGTPGAAPAPRPKPAGPKAPGFRLPSAGSPRCAHNIVLLYAFTKVTPDDYDFPLARKAVKGHLELAGTRFVVTRDLGQRFFAAEPPSFDAGQKLVALVAKEVQGSKPQLLCAEPEVVREVKIDLGTGEIVK
jgi:hypothetical protein